MRHTQSRNFWHTWESASNKLLFLTSCLKRRPNILRNSSTCIIFVYACYNSSMCDIHNAVSFDIYGNLGPNNHSFEQVVWNAEPLYFTSIAYALCLCSLVTKHLYVRHTHTVTFDIYGNPGPRSLSSQQVVCNAKPKYFTSIAYALCLCSLVTQVLYATKSDRVLHGAVPFCGRECRIYHI
jgi:hypothetical protein